ncbi:MAG: cytochrome c class I [Chitinophagaceae bacterium]|nr:MAG: cytochrome c class I [Chitinophagaceae bacterium]
MKYRIIVLVAFLLSLTLIICNTNNIVRWFNPENNKAKTTSFSESSSTKENTTETAIAYWQPKPVNLITNRTLKEQVNYGKELIAHTAKYLGPNGTVLQITNGQNCQNCHLQAGTLVFANNYGSVASSYPKFRARSGRLENIYKRVNDCLERSLNGKALDTTSKEMQAIVAYINHIGSNVPKGQHAAGSGLKDMAYLKRAADPIKGKAVYVTKCQSCHQANGEGVLQPDKVEYSFPPLWGKHSFNDGAGLYRISNFAKYIKYNMPLGVTHENPQLSDEEAWDVSAYVITQSRPHLEVPNDWPDIAKKPIDYPFGPYADAFSQKQHKYGPFNPIVSSTKK